MNPFRREGVMGDVQLKIARPCTRTMAHEAKRRKLDPNDALYVAAFLSLDWVARHEELERLRRGWPAWAARLADLLAPDQLLGGKHAPPRAPLRDTPLATIALPDKQRFVQARTCVWGSRSCAGHVECGFVRS